MDYIIAKSDKSTEKAGYHLMGIFTDKKTTLATKFVDSKYNKRDKKYFEKNIFNKKGVHYLVRTILFDCLDKKRLNSKDLWNSVMFCLKNIEDKFLIKVKDIGIEWSKKSKHYKCPIT